ncbi:unnamed protein product, partial [Staurois parvus]
MSCQSAPDCNCNGYLHFGPYPAVLTWSCQETGYHIWREPNIL